MQKQEIICDHLCVLGFISAMLCVNQEWARIFNGVKQAYFVVLLNLMGHCPSDSSLVRLSR